MKKLLLITVLAAITLVGCDGTPGASVDYQTQRVVYGGTYYRGGLARFAYASVDSVGMGWEHWIGPDSSVAIGDTLTMPMPVKE